MRSQALFTAGMTRSCTMLPSQPRQRRDVTRTPAEGSMTAPMRRSTANSSARVPMPAPRPARSSLLRSNTAMSQPAPRSSPAANNPPTEPPIISARGIVSTGLAAGSRLKTLAQDLARLLRVHRRRDTVLDLPALLGAHQIPAIGAGAMDAEALGDAVIGHIDRLALILRHQDLQIGGCLLYTSPSPRDRQKSRMPSSA